MNKASRKIVYPIKVGKKYRYYDKSKNISAILSVKKIKQGIIYVKAEDGRAFMAKLSDVRFKLFNSLGYDMEGFDVYGYDASGYNREGINRNGVSREGVDRCGNRVGVGSAYEASCYAGKQTTGQALRGKQRK